jgi:hypothetical protein
MLNRRKQLIQRIIIFQYDYNQKVKCDQLISVKVLDSKAQEKVKSVHIIT